MKDVKMTPLSFYTMVYRFRCLTAASHAELDWMFDMTLIPGVSYPSNTKTRWYIERLNSPTTKLKPRDIAVDNCGNILHIRYILSLRIGTGTISNEAIILNNDIQFQNKYLGYYSHCQTTKVLSKSVGFVPNADSFANRVLDQQYFAVWWAFVYICHTTQPSDSQFNTILYYFE